MAMRRSHNFTIYKAEVIENPFPPEMLPPPQALLIESSNRCGRKFRDAQAVLTLAGNCLRIPKFTPASITAFY